MTLDLFHVVMLAVPILLLEGFFSGSEMAILSADKLLLRAHVRRGSRHAELAFELASHPERVLATTLLITCFCVIALSVLITLFLMSQKFRNADLLAVLITSPSVILFGELIPKTIYQRYADRIAPWVAHPIHWVYWIFYPLTRLLSGYTSRISRLMGPLQEILTGKRRSTREELRALLSINRRETELKSTEQRMIKRILDFKDSTAKHALIPLVSVDAIEVSSAIRDALESFKRHRHSRMPVFADRIDNIIGVLEVYDLFAATDLNQSIRNVMTPATYVSETQPLDDLLLEMHREDQEMVVVVDEYGGAVGVITLEDIVEEIVGEIKDEDETALQPYQELTLTSWVVQAQMEIPEINERLHLDLPEGGYETVGGFLLHQFGRIPEVRDELFFDTAGFALKFTIRKASSRQIELVLIEKLTEKKVE